MINTNISTEMINNSGKNTLLEQLGIEITEIGDTFIKGKMPVDHRTLQPAGLLHGGATAALIESLGSIGSSLITDMTKQNIVGLEINTNHIRGVRSGFVTGNAKLVHGGRTTHVWQVDVTNEEQKLVATGRLTVLVIDKKND